MMITFCAADEYSGLEKCEHENPDALKVERHILLAWKADFLRRLAVLNQPHRAT
jgi:hypothetical protein